VPRAPRSSRRRSSSQLVPRRDVSSRVSTSRFELEMWRDGRGRCTRHQIIIVIVFGCQRSGRPVGAHEGRTSGLDAVAFAASAPLAIRDLQSDHESQNQKLS
jgi:hypothetical protein